MRIDWGAAEPPLRDDWPDLALPPDRLPSVRRAREDGWCLAPQAPAWCFLPLVWPTTARAWVPDRSVRVVRMSCDGGPPTEIPWSAWDHEEVERDTNAALASAGLPARPSGRLWLLRPPPGLDDLDTAVEHLEAGSASAGVPLACGSELVAWTRDAVDGWFGCRA